MTMIGLRSDTVVIYAANSTQDGASVLLYNTQFKVVQSRQSFKVFFPDSRMFIVGNHIFLMAAQNFAMIPFRLTRNKLSDLIGSQNRGPNLLENPVEREILTITNDFESALSYNPSPNATSCDFDENFVYFPAKNKRKSAKNAEKRNQFATRTFEDVEEVEDNMKNLFNDDLGVEIVESEIIPEGRVSVRVLQNPEDSHQMQVQFEIVSGQMERNGASEYEISERLFPLLIQATATSDVIIALRRYSHISEKMIVKCLKYAISLPTDEGASDSSDLLNVILSCSFDSPSIMSHLRTRLTLDDTLFLLKTLLSMYNSSELTLERRPDTGPYHNEDKQLLAWVTALIDSHCQQICITKDPEVLNVVNDWQKIIKNDVEALQELDSLRAIIQKFAEGKDLTKNKQSCKFYSVETLKLY